MASSYLGVDIGTTSIKMVEVKEGGKKPQLVNYALLESSGYLARANQALQTSSLKIFESDMVELLKAIVKNMKPGTRNVYASLPPFSSFITLLDFPQMSPKEVEQAMVYQARQYVPLPIAEVALDWVKVAEYEDESGLMHQKLLLISVPREQIAKYQRMFKEAGLSLKALEVESVSVARSLAGDASSTIVIDIGSRSTNIIFMDQGKLIWSMQTDFASASLTQALATSLSINPLRAEELKKERGIMTGGPSYELSTIMLPFVDAIINEVKKAQFTYTQQYPAARALERVVLTGGGANLLGLTAYCEREFGVPAVKAAPFLQVEYAAGLAPIVAELNPVMSVAIGLAMKPFNEN